MLLDKELDRGDFPSCTRCERPENANLRVLWGCDEPSPEPLFALDCWRCRGKDESCEVCKGRARIDIHTCPWQTIDADLRGLVEASIVFLEHGTLPCEGDLLDQTMGFSIAWRIVAQVRNELLDRE